jgi:hypothetical protein
MTQHWDNKTIYRHWARLLGQNALRLENPAAICELIASAIGVAEGKVDLGHMADDLEEAGSSADIAQAVRNTLVDIADR